MRNSFKLLLILLIPALVRGQQHLPDSILRSLKNASNDSLRYQANMQAYFYFEELNKDSAIYYTDQTLSLVKKNNKKLLIARTLANKGYQQTGKGMYAEALNNFLDAFAITEDPKNANTSWFRNPEPSPEKNRLLMLSLIHHMYALLMGATQNSKQEIFHFKEAKRIAREINNVPRIMLADMNLGAAYTLLNRNDSASFFLNEAKYLTLRYGPKKYLGFIMASLGDLALKKGDKTQTKQFYYEGLSEAMQQNNQTSATRLYLRLVGFYLAEGQKDSSLYFAKKLLAASKTMGVTSLTINLGVAYQNLYLSYKLRKQLDSAFKYAGLALVAKDSINKSRIANLAQFQSLSLKEQLRLQNLEKEKALYQSRARTYALLAGLVVFLIIAAILFRNNRQKHKANILLNQQKEEVQNALSRLKATQTQLIQSEKMASLGELTAGIAHEIQNPLNFVNNFSDLNKEMLEELKAESKKPKAERSEQLEVGLVNDLIENETKINHHGKRADAIVKGMLQHSQSGSGTKEPTNINVLADEYLRLSYHGLRSKDKAFNAELVTHFNEKLPQINVIPQDIGRVLLNLFNNAFYAVNQKQKTAAADYKPEVLVSTSTENSHVVIKVKDNGIGMPESIKEKIMQPFFTTKPTGEGTGLGLSLTYDMVVKGHGGTIQVNSTEGEGSEFIIQLPVN
jgi:two-component system, NtrC family, sensor kinase